MNDRFKITQIFDENGYPTDNFLWDRDKLIAEFRHPLNITILELMELYETLEPAVKSYKKWVKKYNKNR